MIQTKYQLIIIILNSGFSETAMDIARAEGVRGGTITHCRGTTNEALAKKYGVYVTPDKEMIWIVTEDEIADRVMTSIHDKISDKNPGQCFVFSLPVESVVGMKINAENAENTEKQ